MGLRPTQDDEERWWRELQLAASASAGVRAATLACSSTERYSTVEVSPDAKRSPAF